MGWLFDLNAEQIARRQRVIILALLTFAALC